MLDKYPAMTSKYAQHDTLQLVSRISLGWSLSLSHAASIRSAARNLHEMAQNLAITASPGQKDFWMLHQLFCALCEQTHSHECRCAKSLRWPDDCPIYKHAAANIKSTHPVTQ